MARLEQQNFGTRPNTTFTITGRDASLGPSLAESNIVDDTESIMTVRGPLTDAQNARSSDQRQTLEYSFDQDLNTSRPYTRAMQNHRASSTTSSEIHTMGWSCLSGLSLAEVSNISVINLPFCPQELWNGHRYFEKRIDRGGLLVSNYRSPLGSARTLLLIGVFPLLLMKGSCCDSQVVNDGNLLGESLSGKTTVFNHLQMLYGRGITDIERLTAFELIIRNLVDILTEALSDWSDIYDQNCQLTDVQVCNPITYYVLCYIIADGAQSPSISGH